MITLNDYGPAFPLISEDHRAIHHLGMSLRDYFAAAALQGMLASSSLGQTSQKDYAWAAYAQADAMLAERHKEAKS